MSVLQKVAEVQAKRMAESLLAWREARQFVRPPIAAWSMEYEGEDGARWSHVLRAVRVIASATREGDGRRWLHVSLSQPNHVPNWETVRMVKDHFIGIDRKAIQVFPRAAEYVNIHPHCLHLWHCMDGDFLPDFTGGSGSI